jgi:HlyD family secretion protein
MSGQKSWHWGKRLFFLAVIACGLAYGAWFFRQQSFEAAPAYQTGPVTRGDLQQVVTASGQLNPVTMVEVGSQISGIIQQLLADFNSTVTQRQVIARIDPATYEANSLQAEGNVASAQAALELAKVDAHRAETLHSNKLNTQADYDNALATLHQAEANVKMKAAALKSAQVDLARCVIYSPIDGLVLSRNVNVGQTVAASLSAPTLFVIANDLTKMQIEANVAEADIGQIEVGQQADFAVDAFPSRTFQGKVSQIRNAPKTDQNVVTYSTIIEVSNPDLKLKPGMTANVSIIIARREQALKVPNAALRFHPPARAEISKTASRAETDPTAKRESDNTGAGHKSDRRRQERVVYLLGCEPGSTQPAVTGRGAGILQPVAIRIGINTVSFTEVLEGLKEGDEVVTGLASTKVRGSRNFNPFATPPRRQ